MSDPAGPPILLGILCDSHWSQDHQNPDREVLVARIKVRCPACKNKSGKPVYHVHGFELGNPEGKGGHRVAHCDDQQAMKQGYCIAADPNGLHAIDPYTAVSRPSRKLRQEKVRLEIRIQELSKRVAAGISDRIELDRATLELDRIKIRMQAVSSQQAVCEVNP